MTLEGFYRDEQTKGPREINNRNYDFRELLELGLAGYVYHPSFLTFLAHVKGGLEQERTEFGPSTSKSSGPTEEYEIRAFFLPNHPYSLELFSLLRKPRTTTSLITKKNPTLSQSGFRFTYKKSPWTSQLGYSHQTLEHYLETGTDSYNARLTYNKRNFRTNVAYLYREYSQSDGGEDDNSYYFLNNEFVYGRLKVNSELDLENTKEKENKIRTKERKKTNWLERIYIDLPFDLTTDASYRKNNMEDEYPLDHDRNRFYYRDYADIHFRHRLYTSLYSDLRLDYGSTEFPSGDVEQRGFLLNETYRKIIAPGLFSTSFWIGQRNSHQTGEPLVIDTIFKASSAGLIILPEKNIDQDTIQVLASAPPHDTRPIELIRGVHYTLNSIFQDTTEIHIIGLPPEISGILDFTELDFFISYSVQPADLELRTDKYGTTVRFDLFDRRLSPYFTHDVIDTSLVSGYYDGEPERRVRDIYGTIARYLWFTYVLEYTHIESNRYPSKSWLTRLEYNQRLTERTDVHLGLEYRRRTYPAEKVLTAVREQNYKEEETSITSRVSKDISNGFHLNLDARYRHLSNFQEINFYSATTSINWRFGKSRLEMTVDCYYSDTRNPEGFDTKLTNKAIYFKYNRILFQN